MTFFRNIPEPEAKADGTNVALGNGITEKQSSKYIHVPKCLPNSSSLSTHQRLGSKPSQTSYNFFTMPTNMASFYHCKMTKHA